MPLPSISSQTTRVDLLRHGKPLNDGCLSGRSDVALSEQGWQQLNETMKERLSYDRVVSSPLIRCSAFARQYSHSHNLPLIIQPAFQEMCFGQWDGLSYQELHRQSAQALSGFWSDPWNNTPPDGETMEEFSERIILAWNELLKEYRGSRVLLVCHSGVIRMLIAHLLEMDLKQNLVMSRLEIPYGSLSRIEVYHDEEGRDWPRLMTLNAGV